MAQAIPQTDLPAPDYWLPGAALVLLALGWVMVGSSSITIAERELGQPFYYLLRQAAYIGVGLVLALAVLRTRLSYWEKAGAALLALGVGLLILVLIPGIGRQVNGSLRWLAFGPFNVQPSELVKLCVVVYMSGYLVRRGQDVNDSAHGFLRPVGIVAVIALLLLMEPDFGATVVIVSTVLGMLFLNGVRLRHFGALIALASTALAILAFTSPYRLQRLTTFLDPWADPYNSGFQLTQALIAFGRGEWFGVGLGGSVQKLFYLPEAHTDFLFAVLAEELGLAGACLVIGLFGVLVWRAFSLAKLADQAGQRFAALLAYGLGLWLALQSFINLGVNMGMLPTKGLTLPLMSYGGSSIVVSCVAVALLMRIDKEVRSKELGVRSNTSLLTPHPSLTEGRMAGRRSAWR